MNPNHPAERDIERELLPCPFCGGAATLAPTSTMWMAECNNFDCSANPDVLKPFKHEAIAAWNRRAAQATAEPVQGMSDAVDACTWTLEDEDNGIWESSCGEAWSFTDGGPKENRVSFCHNCGKSVHLAARSQQSTGGGNGIR